MAYTRWPDSYRFFHLSSIPANDNGPGQGTPHLTARSLLGSARSPAKLAVGPADYYARRATLTRSGTIDHRPTGRGHRSRLLAWLGLIAVLYRIGLWWVGFEGSCRCLGNLGDVFGISAETADWIAKGILGYLLVGSAAILLGHLSRRGHGPDADAPMRVGAATNLSFEPEARKPRS